MFHFRLVLIVLSLFFFITAFSQNRANKLSNQIKGLNQQSFNIKDDDPFQARKLNQKAFKLLKKGPTDAIVKSDVYSVAGNLDFQKGYYDLALSHFLISLIIRQKTSDTIKIADMMLNIANTYYCSKKYRKSINYYHQSLNRWEKLKKNTLDIIPIYNGLAQVYESNEINKPDSAFYYYDRAINLTNQLSNVDLQSQFVSDLYSNIGQYYETHGDYANAMLYYEKTLEIQQQIEDQYGKGWTYHHIGILYDEQQNSPNAKMYFHKAEEIAQEFSNSETLRDISESWMLLYIREKKTDSVSYYYNQYKKYNEDFNELETRKNVQEIGIIYQTNKQKIKLKNVQDRENLIWIGISITTLFILIFLIFLIRNHRQKQRISRMQVDLKSKEINALLTQQETASYAAMLEGQDQERLRIAQDLHDRLGSTLAAIKLGMQGNPVTTNTQNQRLVDTAITEVRSIAHNLSAGNIERYGLQAALEELKRTLERSGKINVHLYLQSLVINNLLSIELYRILQELVSNTLKHANASEITIQLNDQTTNLNVMYEDNGSGFDQQQVNYGIGIQNIQHRLKKWTGTIEFDTQPTRGTIVILNIPITSNHD